MKPVYIPEAEQDFISTIKGGKTYYVLENRMLLQKELYNAIVSELRPDIVDTIILPGGYGWTSRLNEEIYDELKAALAGKGYEPTFKTA